MMAAVLFVIEIVHKKSLKDKLHLNVKAHHIRNSFGKSRRLISVSPLGTRSQTALKHNKGLSQRNMSLFIL